MNIIELLSDYSGLSHDEVAWTWNRMVELLQQEGKTRDEAVDIIIEESKTKPWLFPPSQ